MILIGLSGFQQVGKDTVGEILVKQHGYQRFAFADKVRECALAIDPFVDRERGTRLSALVKLLGWERAKHDNHEVRRLLQRVGTEMGRKVLDDDIWVDTLFDQLVDLPSYPEPKVVITDMRFPNEFIRVSATKGTTVLIYRPGFGAKPGPDGKFHDSETALNGYDFDWTIVNDSTLEDLSGKVAELADSLAR